MRHSVSIYEAKTNFSKYVDLALSGEEVIVTNRGREVIALTPLKNREQTGFGILSGAFEDFDWEKADSDFQASFNQDKLS